MTGRLGDWTSFQDLPWLYRQSCSQKRCCGGFCCTMPWRCVQAKLLIQRRYSGGQAKKPALQYPEQRSPGLPSLPRLQGPTGFSRSTVNGHHGSAFPLNSTAHPMSCWYRHVRNWVERWWMPESVLMFCFFSFVLPNFPIDASSAELWAFNLPVKPVASDVM